jgi:DNA modification methylase
MAKDTESLMQSRDIRAYLLNKWGRVPTSIWKVDWSIKYIELSRSYSEQQKENAEILGTELINKSKAFALSSSGNSGIKALGMSKFPQDILYFLVKFLTPAKLKEPGYFNNYLPTVIDPFAGHNSRGEGCWRCDKNYVGWDISKSHNEMNNKVYRILNEENDNSMIKREARIQFIEGDSRDIAYNEQFDFSITSPPFYDSEYYGDEPEQLGRQYTYNDFLGSLTKIYENVYRALKPNSFCVVETNDFRRKGEFHTYHADLIGILKKAGFTMHDMIICDYGSGFYEAFLSDIEANKIVSKNHSYFAIARKLPRRIESRTDTRERLINEINDKDTTGEINDFVVDMTKQGELF